jgi:long-subunit acyl-CoA synthetase (AMP-forming)
VTIPIAAQATSSHLLYVLRNTSLSVLVIDETHLEFVLQLIEGTAVKHIVAIRDTIEEDNFVERSKYFGVTIHSLNQIKKLGQQEPVERSIEIGKCIR